jgi:hypothetical protein
MTEAKKQQNTQELKEKELKEKQELKKELNSLKDPIWKTIWKMLFLK